jgi:hypothetical protein
MLGQTQLSQHLLSLKDTESIHLDLQETHTTRWR